MTRWTIRTDVGFAPELASLPSTLRHVSAGVPDIVALRGAGWARRAADALDEGAPLVVAIDDTTGEPLHRRPAPGGGRLVVLSALVCAVGRHRALLSASPAPVLVEVDLPTTDRTGVVDALTAASLLLPDVPLEFRARSTRATTAVITGSWGGTPLLVRTGVPVRRARLRMLGADSRIEVDAPPVDSAAPIRVRVDDGEGERTAAADYESTVRHALRTRAESYPIDALRTRAGVIRALDLFDEEHG